MAEFVEVTIQKYRMCNAYPCEKCPITNYLREKEYIITCNYFCEKHPQEAEQIIMDWAKENQVISNIDKLYQIVKESFGEDIAENFKAIFEERPCCAVECNHDLDCKKCENHKFWQQEWKDPKDV